MEKKTCLNLFSNAKLDFGKNVEFLNRRQHDGLLHTFKSPGSTSPHLQAPANTE
jgi:hypothetical protein